MKLPSLIRYLDQYLHYSSFAGIRSFRRLYRWHKKFLGLILFQVPEQLPVSLDLLIGVAKQGWQLLLKLCGRGQFLGLSKQEIYRYRFLPEPLSGDDL